MLEESGEGGLYRRLESVDGHDGDGKMTGVINYMMVVLYSLAYDTDGFERRWMAGRRECFGGKP